MQEVTENMEGEIPPEEEAPAAEAPMGDSQCLSEIRSDLQGIQESLQALPAQMSESAGAGRAEEFAQAMERLDAIAAELARINEREDVRDEERAAEMEAAAEAAAEAEEAGEPSEEIPSEPEPSVPDYTEDMRLLADSLAEVNGHLDSLLVYQRSQQNVQIPMLCAVSLCFGGILAIILSNYLKH